MTALCHRHGRLSQWSRSLAVFTLTGLLATFAQAQVRLELEPASADRPAAFVAAGLSESEMAAYLRLSAEQQAAAWQARVATASATAPAITGERTVDDNSLRFTPRYPLEPGVRYRVLLDRAALGEQATASLDREFEIARPATQPTSLTAVYPTTSRLPENQLKFYLHFSAPMSRGEAYRHVHLYDSAGKEVAGAFLELNEELWDTKQQRFTLLFDPGRIKRGLVPRAEEGPILVEDRDFTFVVDNGWRDAHGVPLKESVKKSIHVLPPRESPLATDSWKFDLPPAGGKDPLVVRFAAPLDHAMLAGCLKLVDNQGQALVGKSEIGDEEKSWRFTPVIPWRAGPLKLQVDTALEDLSGNTLKHAFDVDVFGPIQKQILTETIEIPLRIGQ